MKSDENDDRIGCLFQEAREQDARHAPAFSRVWASATHRPPASRLLPWLRMAAAAVVVAGATSLAVFHARTSSSVTETSSWSALSNWQASTDGLLTVSSTPWGSRVAVPSDSWTEVDLSVSETVKPSGKESL